MRHTHIARATLVGSSHGGGLALEFALAHPKAVSRLILVGAVVSGLPFTEHFMTRAAAINQPLSRGDIDGR